MEKLACASAAPPTRPPPATAARPRAHEFGPIEFVRLDAEVFASESDPARVIAPKGQGYAFLLLARGAAMVQHYGHDCPLREGDFVLVDGSTPLAFHCEARGELIALRVAPRVLRNYLPAPDPFCGRPLRSGDGLTEGIAQIVQSVLAQVECGLSPHFYSRIARNLLDTLATAFSMALSSTSQGSPLLCSRNARVRLRVEQDLRDPGLRPATIALRLRMSPRYLRAIFASSGETVSAYVLRRRLEECARELADPRLGGMSITEIAFGWGFNSAPHFTRSFRNHYGVSPRQFRQAAARISD
jgi:AraC-like DNA-binding protein